MNIVPVIMGLVAGISLCAGIIFLLIGYSRHPRNITHITFAATVLAITGHTLSIYFNHKAANLETYITAFKIGFGPFTLLTLVSFIWFVGFYTGVRPYRFLVEMTVWLFVIAVLMLVLSYTLLFDEISALRPINLPWGEQIVIQLATPHPWRLFVDLFLLFFFGYLLYATYRQIQQGEKRKGLFLGIAICLLFVFNILDSLIDIAVIDFFYTSEIGYLGIVGIMSYQLISEIQQLDTELNKYRNNLEQLVAERKHELEITASALQKSERLTHALFDAPPATAMLITPDGEILATNQIVATRMGLPADRLVTAIRRIFMESIDKTENQVKENSSS